MPEKLPLLDLLCLRMGCEFLSDLRFLSPARRRELARELARIPVREEDRAEWNDTLQYLAQSPPEKTAREARDHLVRQLYTGPGTAQQTMPGDRPYGEEGPTMKTSVHPRSSRGLLPVLLSTAACVMLGLLLVGNLIIIVKGTLQPEKPPSVLGITPLVVLSGSMSGTIEAGDLIFVSPAAPETLAVGDVIAYLSDGAVVTHRIIAVEAGEDGALRFTTKGDANNTADQAPVTADQLVGVYRGRLPGAGDFALFLRSPLGMLLFIGVPVMAFILYDILRRRRDAIRERRRARELEAELNRLRAMNGADAAPPPGDISRS